MWINKACVTDKLAPFPPSTNPILAFTLAGLLALCPCCTQTELKCEVAMLLQAKLVGKAMPTLHTPLSHL